MNNELEEDAERNEVEATRPRPLQFRLGALMVITALVAVLFSTLGWMGVSERARMVILVVLAASVIAAVGLLFVIAGSGSEQDE